MKLSEFDYDNPEELIAQYPSKERDECRLMVLDRKMRTISHKRFKDIVGYFDEGDCVVLNDTKVIPARLLGRRKTGGKVEIFLLDRPSAEKNSTCEALIKPSARLKNGEKVTLESGDEVEILNSGDVGRFVRFNNSVADILKKWGHIPLPPYIERVDLKTDKDDYQTVYARKEGATASPTAGLHFTNGLIDRIKGKGMKIAHVTLHTNYGTFAPIKVENIEEHKMQKEYFEFPKETAEIINETKKNGNKVLAVGTTTARALEHYALQTIGHRPPWPASNKSQGGQTIDLHDYTDLYIYPGFKFKIVDHLITNFHLPKSTLVLLVSAFAGRDFIFEAYRKAIEERYRFYSYGDAMLIL